MKILLRVGVIVVLFVTCAWATSNLNLSKSNINRLSRATLVSASTTLSGAISQIVYRTPSSGDFVLTQVCTGISNGGASSRSAASASRRSGPATARHSPACSCRPINC